MNEMFYLEMWTKWPNLVIVQVIYAYVLIFRLWKHIAKFFSAQVGTVGCITMGKKKPHMALFDAFNWLDFNENTKNQWWFEITDLVRLEMWAFYFSDFEIEHPVRV